MKEKVKLNIDAAEELEKLCNEALRKEFKKIADRVMLRFLREEVSKPSPNWERMPFCIYVK